MYSKKAYPYPEIVTGDKWHVLETTEHDSQPRTDNLNKQMYVPMDRECEYCGVNHSRMIRRHELGHAKWSPKTMGKLMRGTRADAVHALEEVRINYLLEQKAKLGMDELLVCREEAENKIQQLIFTGSVADIILFLLASYTLVKNENGYYEYGEQFTIATDYLSKADKSSDITDLRKAQLRFATSTAETYIRRLTTHKWNQTPSYRKVQKLAEKLSIILNEFIDKPTPDEVRTSNQPGQSTKLEECTNTNEDGETCNDETKCEPCEEKQAEQYEAGTGDSTIDSLEKRMRSELVEKMTYNSVDGVGRWGDMQIHEPPLNVNLQGRLKNSRHYRPADFGYNPKYINRYCIDKKIFKQKQNVKGGTILIDASGSMDFTGKDILDIMQLLPAVNIAMYNGSYNTGDLRIIAKNGMRVDDTYLSSHSGKGNVIDGPALRWLASMPARRIWVSDMYVFGASSSGHSSGFNLLKECYDICTQNKIINLKDIEEVKEHALKLNTVL